MEQQTQFSSFPNVDGSSPLPASTQVILITANGLSWNNGRVSIQSLCSSRWITPPTSALDPVGTNGSESIRVNPSDPASAFYYVKCNGRWYQSTMTVVP